MDDECIELFLEHDTWYVPTLAISHLTPNQAGNEWERRWLAQRNLAPSLCCRADAAVGRACRLVPQGARRRRQDGARLRHPAAQGCGAAGDGAVGQGRRHALADAARGDEARCRAVRRRRRSRHGRSRQARRSHRRRRRTRWKTSTTFAACCSCSRKGASSPTREHRMRGPGELDVMTARTLAHYDRHAESFWQGTRDHDVRQNIDALLRAIEGSAAVRDTRFRLRSRARSRGVHPARARRNRARGLAAPGDDGARVQPGARSGSRTSSSSICLSGRFDGVFANAALFHVPSRALPRVLLELQPDAQAPRRAIQLQPARQQRGRVERRALRRVPRSRSMATLPVGRRLRRGRALLPARGLAARAAAVAGERVAGSGVMMLT